MTQWDELSVEQQTALLNEYGHYLDSLPATCDMRTKQELFQAWLAKKNIDYQFD